MNLSNPAAHLGGVFVSNKKFPSAEGWHEVTGWFCFSKSRILLPPTVCLLPAGRTPDQRIMIFQPTQYFSI